MCYVGVICIIFEFLICWELQSTFNYQSPPPRILWLVPGVIGATSVGVKWPSKIKQEYENLKNWIFGKLLIQGSVSLQEVQNKFASKGKEEYGWLLIHRFKVEYIEELKVVELRNGHLVLRVPPPTNDSVPPEKPP